MLAALAALIGLGCTKRSPPVAQERVSLVRRGATQFSLIPKAGQFPYCVAFSLGSDRTVRQLTLASDDRSPACPAGVPIGGVQFQLLPLASPARILVVFSSEAVKVSSIGRQVDALQKRETIAAYDLRIPGEATLQTLHFEIIPDSTEAPR